MILAALCLFAATAATAETRTMSDIRYGAEGDHRLDVYWDDARSGFKPRFVRRYADLHEVITNAVSAYVADVRSKSFPNADEQY